MTDAGRPDFQPVQDELCKTPVGLGSLIDQMAHYKLEGSQVLPNKELVKTFHDISD